jgi:hypothetical protein
MVANRFMRLEERGNAAWRAALRVAVLVVLASRPAMAAGDACRLVKLAELPVSFTREQRPLIAVSANGTTLSMELSTQSPFSIISTRTVAQLGLPSRTPDFEGGEVDINNTKLTKTVTIPAFTLGQGMLSEATVFVDSSNNVGFNYYDGIIGQDILHHFDIELDLGHSRIALFSRDHCRDKVVYWPGDYGELPLDASALHYLIFRASVDGKETVTTIGTSEPVSVVPRDVAISRFHVDASASASACDNAVKVPGFAEIDLGGTVIVHPGIAASCEHPICPMWDYQPDLLLGLNHLKRLRIFIDNADSKIFFSPL